MGLAVAVRGPCRSRPRQLPFVSSAASQIYPQQSEDPDLSLSAPFPITKDSFTRKAIRDLTGQTFVNQRLPLLLSLFRRKGADDTESDESFPFSHARTTLAGPIERLLIAPYWVNYHAEHHLFMYLPCYRLPEAHRLLIKKGLIKRMEVRPGYLDVMRLATSGQLG